MLIRNCVGGIIFFGHKVFLLKNDKEEWVLQKRFIRQGELPVEAVTKHVFEDCGILASVLSVAGESSYDFFSISRQKPVCNKIVWFLMSTDTDRFSLSEKSKYHDGGFFFFDHAMHLITHGQDKSLMSTSFEKYKSLVLR